MTQHIVAPPGKFVQEVNTQSGAYSSGTNNTPFDDTIPQVAEQNLLMSRTITPKDAANILIVDVTVFYGDSAQNKCFIGLYQDAVAGALAGGGGDISVISNIMNKCTFRHRMVAGTTSEITFKVYGAAVAGTFYFNGDSGGRKYGGVLASSITVREMRP